MALEMVTWTSLLKECCAVGAGDHTISTCNVHPAHNNDELLLTAFCDDCKQFYFHRVSYTAIRASRDTAQYAADCARTFISFLASRPCVGSGTISAIAQWLTDKLADMPMSSAMAEILWQREGETWTRETVRAVAQELGFLHQGWLELPAEHPLAKAA